MTRHVDKGFALDTNLDANDLPLVKGGQGRADEEIEATGAAFVGFAVALAIVAALVLAAVMVFR